MGLNTPKCITPLAFQLGEGRRSVYDLSEEELTKMVNGHIKGEYFSTEFSSWTASISYAMDMKCFAKRVYRANTYISIIDTKALPVNQIFHVPSLEFLAPGVFKPYDHEYLAHGVITGSAHRAVLLKDFHAAVWNYGPSARHIQTCRPIPKEMIVNARFVGQHYGNDFALPIMLALICVARREAQLFDIESEQFNAVWQGIAGLRVPEDWSKAKTIMEDIVTTQGWHDIKQFIQLMRAVGHKKAHATEPGDKSLERAMAKLSINVKM